MKGLRKIYTEANAKRPLGEEFLGDKFLASLLALLITLLKKKDMLILFMLIF